MTHSPSSIRCQVSERNDDYLVELKITQGNNMSTYQFSIDKSECPVSYSVFLALTDFFEEYKVSSPVILHVNDLFAFNILNDYLKRWKASNWFGSNGKPVKYVDILSEFYDTVATKQIKYKVLFTS